MKKFGNNWIFYLGGCVPASGISTLKIINLTWLFDVVMADQLQPWFHGNLPTGEATKICSIIRENGAFLIRESQTLKNAYTLSML